MGKKERFQDIAVYLTSNAATIEPFDWQELRREIAIICAFKELYATVVQKLSSTVAVLPGI